MAAALLVSGGLFCLTTVKPLMPPFESAIRGWDDSFYYFWLRSPMIDGDVDFSNDIVYCDTMPSALKEYALKSRLTGNGLIPNKYPVGWAVSGLPWFLLGDMGTRTARLFNSSLLLDGYGPLYQLMLMLGQLVYAAGSLFFSHRILKHYFSGDTSLEAVLMVWLGSFMLAYQAVFLSMSHNVTFFALTGTYYFTMRIKASPARTAPWFAAGILSGLLVLSRYQAVLFLIYPAAVMMRLLLSKTGLLSRVMIYVMTFCLMIIPQLIAWKALYGHYITFTYKGEGFSWLSPHFPEALFSPFHGLFYWHPLYLIAFAGFFVWVWKQRNIEAFCWTLSLAAMMYVNTSLDHWWFDASFGGRAYEGLTLFAMTGTAALIEISTEKGPLARRSLIFVLLCLAFWNINLLVIFLKGSIATEAPVTYTEMLKGTLAFWFNI